MAPASLAPFGPAARPPDTVELFSGNGEAELCLLLSHPLSSEQAAHHAPEYPTPPDRGASSENIRTSVSAQPAGPPAPGPQPCAITTMTPGRREYALRPKKTILCVDDNEQVLSVRTFLLETRGYRVIPVLSAQHALEIVEQSIPGSIDLLLSDLLMPQMDGNELIRRAKQLHPSLPAMIVSGTVGSFDRASYADVFLPKGACSPAEMIERIRVLVARKRGPKKAMPMPPAAQVFATAAAS